MLQLGSKLRIIKNTVIVRKSPIKHFETSISVLERHCHGYRASLSLFVANKDCGSVQSATAPLYILLYL